jgi:GT2 family glycosyltransferase
VPDAFIYHLQGQSIGHNIGSRIEFYRARSQFLRKWHNPLYYYLASGVVFLRLLINWMFSFVAVAMTLGLAKKLTQKLAVYSQLICWYIKKI